MSSTRIGVIDQGTKSTKFGVFDREGKLLAQHSEDHEAMYPQSGWVEYDPVEIWENTLTAFQTTLSTLDMSPAEMDAIGIANHRETTIVWDSETGEPVRNAVSWQDRRHTDRIEMRREAGLTEPVRSITGLELDPFYSAGKLEWLLEDVPGLRERGRAGEVSFGTIDTWLLSNLTGVHATDVTNASRTMLFDIHELAWSERLLEEFDVPAPMLPEVYPSSHDDAYGRTEPNGPVRAEIPVTAVLADQQSALVGHTAFDAGDVKHTVGSSCVMQLNTGTEAVESEHGLATTVAYQFEGSPARYALEGQIFTGGQAIEWLHELGVLPDIEEAESMARNVGSTGGVYFVPAFQGLATPYWDPTARGTMVGMHRGTSRETLVRATLEAIGYRTRDATDAMRSDTDLPVDTLRVDGGMSQNEFLCEFIANASQTVIEVADETETTSLGAAYAAGLAVGVWSGLDQIRQERTTAARFEPDRSNEEMITLYEDWQRAVERSLDWAREDDRHD